MEPKTISKQENCHLKKRKIYIPRHHINDDGIIKARFRSKPVCPHCGAKGKGVSKKGKTSTGKQRFICQHCHKTFIATTNCAMHNSKKDFSVWEKYLRCFLEKKFMREAAEECGISELTAWRWRHKICASLQSILSNPKSHKLITAFDIRVLDYDEYKHKYGSSRCRESDEWMQSILKKIREYIKRFHGIKSKYIYHYAAWYFLTQYTHFSPQKRISLLHKLVYSDPCYTKVRDIGNNPATPAP